MSKTTRRGLFGLVAGMAAALGFKAGAKASGVIRVKVPGATRPLDPSKFTHTFSHPGVEPGKLVKVTRTVPVGWTQEPAMRDYLDGPALDGPHHGAIPGAQGDVFTLRPGAKPGELSFRYAGKVDGF